MLRELSSINVDVSEGLEKVSDRNLQNFVLSGYTYATLNDNLLTWGDNMVIDGALVRCKDASIVTIIDQRKG